MDCPGCGAVVEAGDHGCQCGRYYFHAWTGGGVLISPTGTWRYTSADDQWVLIQSRKTEVQVPKMPAVAEMAGTPLLTQIMAEGLRQIVVPVVIQIQL